MPLETTVELSHRGAYKNNSMCLPILGNINNINNITRDIMLDYRTDNYFGENMFIIGTGDHDHR